MINELLSKSIVKLFNEKKFDFGCHNRPLEARNVRKASLP
ncbi:hypothetical protein LLB_1807 [Legionella longbeachae D-4968]|nr:hypothetical protein LLB_1807 [Legionella longbeachae D-4968]